MLPTKSAYLLSLQTEAWIEMAKQRQPAEKELVIGGGAANGQLALSIKNGECTKVAALHCDHEQIDTRMLLHAKHASQDFFKSIYFLQKMYKTNRLAPNYLITSVLVTIFLIEKGTVSIQNKTCSFDLLIEK